MSDAIRPEMRVADAAPVVAMAEARLAQLAAENRRLRADLARARLAALDDAAAACAVAEAPNESGGVWLLGATDPITRQACLDAVRRLAHAELTALAKAEPAGAEAAVVRLGH